MPLRAQVKNGVAGIYGFYQEASGGAQQVDEHGKPIKNVRQLLTFYAETRGKQLPVWSIIYSRYGNYAVQAQAVDSGKAEVGKLNERDSVARIRAKRGNRLWLLTVLPMKARTPNDISTLLLKNEAVVVTTFGNKKFYHPIKKLTVLEPIQYP